ncbi:hypothetical protein A9K55_003570 [Cordyceps militaris]|uniref:Uncharacterized protein n=1 Tax=Cordyceps militaris TaxID=73501 RepID=A0A2H4S6K2_CORMI|nr:hypothetical protein A9K55_003570 [Cordyceps militaris]
MEEKYAQDAENRKSSMKLRTKCKEKAQRDLALQPSLLVCHCAKRGLTSKLLLTSSLDVALCIRSTYVSRTMEAASMSPTPARLVHLVVPCKFPARLRNCY